MPWPSGPVVTSTVGATPRFGMAGRSRVGLAEGPQVLDRQVVAELVGEAYCRMQAVPVAHDETVAVAPARVGGVVTHDASPERHAQRREGHRGAAVPGVGGRRRVHGHRGDLANGPTFEFGGAGKESVGHGYDST